MRQGFVHVDPLNPQRNGRLMAEVYTHAAMVALWNLPKTIKYKKGSAAEKRLGLNTLRTHLSRLSNAEPPLRRTDVLSKVLKTELSQLSGQKLKDHEDQLDALFCAYLAYYFWYWGWERNEVFGDLESGYILNPKLHTDESGAAAIVPSSAAQSPRRGTRAGVSKVRPALCDGSGHITSLT